MLLHYRSPRLVIYYSGLFFMSIILAIVRYLLRHTFPEQHAFMRPCERSGDCSDPLTKAGCLVVIWQLRYMGSPAYTLPPRL
jgi:hypothetical protein